MADGERESTMRKVVSFGGNDALHKGINWTTLVGTAVVAVLGYLADQKRGKSTEAVAGAAAGEMAALEEWEDSAKQQIASQFRQIARLREDVAALKALSGARSMGPPAPDDDEREADEATDNERDREVKAAKKAAAIKRRLLGAASGELSAASDSP